MKTKLTSSVWAARYSFGRAVCAGAVLLIASSGPAQILFEADASSGNIYEFTAGGVQSTFASGLTDLGDLAFDSAGNLFLANLFGDTITEITPGGVQTTFASGLNHPRGLAFNSAGNLFEADSSSGNIYEFTPGGVQSTFATGLSNPSSLAFNSAGNLFEADSDSGKIYEFTPGGVRSTFASGLNNLFPTSLAFNSAGNLFVAEVGPSWTSIIMITPGGVQSSFFSIDNYNVQNMVFNNAGNLFASIAPAPNNYGYNGQIIEITPDGGVTTFASMLDSPVGIAFQAVPEPSASWLLAFGVFEILLLRRRQR